MRIITGSARGTKLMTLEGDTTRPTTERVKEALFSMIQFDIEGRYALDLFAGSGQLGLEALSRGASGCDFVDASAEAIKIISANVTKTHFSAQSSIFNSDWKQFIARTKDNSAGKYGLIFLDPPYASGFTGEALRALIDAEMIADGATIICESGQDEYIGGEGLSTLRRVSYGIVHLTLLRFEKGGNTNE